MVSGKLSGFGFWVLGYRYVNPLLLHYITEDEKQPRPAGLVPPHDILLPGSKSRQKCLLLRRACCAPAVCGVYKIRCVRFTTEHSTEPGPLERPFLLCRCLVWWLSELPAFPNTQHPTPCSLLLAPCSSLLAPRSQPPAPIFITSKSIH